MLKMKKIMITGMAFLIAMTALAGCGNVTETETTEETSAADGNQEISVSSGGNLTIPVDELTENADGKIQISYDFLKDSADIFANWKGAYQS